MEDGKLRCGDAEFNLLYVDVNWLDASALAEIARLASLGLPVCMKKRPSKPGLKESEGFEEGLDLLMSMENVVTEPRGLVPLVEGDDPPEFMCRLLEESAVFFFAHPKSKELAYPMSYGQSFADGLESPSAIFTPHGPAEAFKMCRDTCSLARKMIEAEQA